MQRYKYLPNITLTGIHSSGKAIGKKNNTNIFVNFGIPGEVTDLKVAKRQKQRFIAGSIDKIITASENRVIPSCMHFGACGGCNWMHMDYDSQLRLKREILCNALNKYEISTPDIPNVIPSPKQEYYRNRLEFAFATKFDSNEKPSVYLGFHPIENTFLVLEIEECFLQSTVSIDICNKISSFVNQHCLTAYDFNTGKGLLRNLIIRTATTDDIMLIVGLAYYDKTAIELIMSFIRDNFHNINSLYYTILTNPMRGFADGEIVFFFGKPIIEEKMSELSFQISPKAFYQPNPLQAENVYKQIKEYAKTEKDDFVYDLYTGTGTIACFLSEYAGKIIGIEGCEDAIDDAKQNAERNSLKNLEFLAGDILKTFTTDFVDKYPKPDVIILDPPRSGTLIEIKKTMLYANPSRIVYVSCNPVSLAWDLKQLTEKYEVKAIQPFDMFPQTHHVETVVLLEKRK